MTMPMPTPSRRVAFLSEHASPVALLGSVDAGGQNVYVDEVSRQLVRHGYLVDVFTRRDNAESPDVIEWAPGVRIINLAVGSAEFVPKDDLWPLMPEFRDAVARFAEHTSTRYDLLHGNFWMSGWVAAQLGERFGLPVMQIFHATGKTKRRHQQEADTSPAERIAVECEVVLSVDRIIAQCPAEETELIDDYAADPDRVIIIPSAVNVERYRPVNKAETRQRLGLPADAPIVGYIGRMLPRKDPRNIVRALALLTESSDQPVTLLLVGGETCEPDPIATPEIGELQRLAAKLGIADRLIFTGKRQPDELRDYYSAVDVAVTTPWYEPFGLTPLEAMACGTPIIGSAVGGITYTVEDGKTGYLVPPHDPETLALRLRQVLSDPDLQARMGRAGRARVVRDFTWETVGTRTAALYDEVLLARTAVLRTTSTARSFELGRS